MARIPGWQEDHEAWERVVFIINGARATIGRPFGLAEVTEGGHERKEDVIDVPGTDGETVNHLGYAGVAFNIDVTLFEDGHWHKYRAVYDLLKPAKGNPAFAVGVIHPVINAAGVTALWVYRLTVPVKVHASGLYKAQIILREFIEQRQATGVLRVTGPAPDLATQPAVIRPSQQGVDP